MSCKNHTFKSKSLKTTFRMRLKTTFFGGFSRFQKLNFSIKRSYLSISMMSNSKKVTDWTEFEINDKKWLPLDVKLGMLASFLCF